MMAEESERFSLRKEKFKALGMLVYYLLNEGNFMFGSKVYLNDIVFFSD